MSMGVCVTLAEGRRHCLKPPGKTKILMMEICRDPEVCRGRSSSNEKEKAL